MCVDCKGRESDASPSFWKAVLVEVSPKRYIGRRSEKEEMKRKREGERGAQIDRQTRLR